MRWARLIERIDNASHRVPMPYWLRCRICDRFDRAFCDAFDRALGLTDREIRGPK